MTTPRAVGGENINGSGSPGGWELPIPSHHPPAPGQISARGRTSRARGMGGGRSPDWTMGVFVCWYSTATTSVMSFPSRPIRPSIRVPPCLPCTTTTAHSVCVPTSPRSRGAGSRPASPSFIPVLLIHLQPARLRLRRWKIFARPYKLLLGQHQPLFLISRPPVHHFHSHLMHPSYILTPGAGLKHTHSPPPSVTVPANTNQTYRPARPGPHSRDSSAAPSTPPTPARRPPPPSRRPGPTSSARRVCTSPPLAPPSAPR